MNISCPRCGASAEAAGHEDGRAYFACPQCQRIFSAALASFAPQAGPTPGTLVTRVMVVDDSAEMVGLLRMWLEDEGCEVFTALSGRDGLDLAATYYPDIVFLDLIMPHPDGFHVCCALRQRLAPEVILMTGVSNPEARRRGAELGVVALLEKPFTRDAAIAAYNTAVERCRRDPLSRLRAHFGGVPRLPAGPPRK
jgi:CheY-like chemotaxis protein